MKKRFQKFDYTTKPHSPKLFYSFTQFGCYTYKISLEIFEFLILSLLFIYLSIAPLSLGPLVGWLVAPGYRESEPNKVFCLMKFVVDGWCVRTR